jgi:hypothetical protein
MPTVAITVPDYDPQVGVVTGGSAGTIRVDVAASGIEITGDSAGLLDLARWCLALAAPGVPAGVHAIFLFGEHKVAQSVGPEDLLMALISAEELRAIAAAAMAA